LIVSDWKRIICESSFLNDNLIDFRLKSLILTGTDHHTMHNSKASQYSYAFSTMFYKKLSEWMVNSDLEEYLTVVRRWNKSFDMLKYKMLFIPVYGSTHWSLIVVINPCGIRKVLAQNHFFKLAIIGYI